MIIDMILVIMLILGMVLGLMFFWAIAYAVYLEITTPDKKWKVSIIKPDGSTYLSKIVYDNKEPQITHTTAGNMWVIKGDVVAPIGWMIKVEEHGNA